MTKTVNLLGIRNKTVLCRINSIKGCFKVIMQSITEEQEKTLDKRNYINIDGEVIPKDNIYCYGEINLDNDDDIKYIEKFNLIENGENSNTMPSRIDWEKGLAVSDDYIIRYAPTWDCLKWFEYNYLLIGRPQRIIVYKMSNVYRRS